MSYFVYVLESRIRNRLYVGSCGDVPDRLRSHNAGKVVSTKAYRPWQLIRVEEYSSKTEALKRERQIKTSGLLRKLLKNRGPIV